MRPHVTGRLQHAARELADRDEVAFAHRDVDAGNLRGLLARRHHAAEVLLLQRLDAAGMIGVMVRDQDVGQPPSGSLQGLLDSGRVGCVDGGCGATGRIVKKDAVIVLQAKEQMSFSWHS
jgi:hypothetical protein